MRFYPRKVDRNHRAIADALTAAGCTVESLHMVGKGCPDLLVGLRGSTWLVEVKDEAGQIEFKDGSKSHGAVTRKRQKEWAARWRGTPVVVVRSPSDALKALGLTGTR